MDLLAQLKRLLGREPPTSVPALDEWFMVTFDSEFVRLRASPPGGARWTAKIAWASIIRVCYEAEDHTASDGLYVFTSERPESYTVPTEANGGSELWIELIRRGLFDAELAIEAASSVGGLYCWPPVESVT